MTDAAPTTVNRTLRRLPNAAYRQVERLIEAARKRSRNGPRDTAAILLAYRHGLRAQELCSLRWSQISATAAFTSIEPKAGSKVCIPYTDLNSEPYVHC